jgi:hypothetical protein
MTNVSQIVIFGSVPLLVKLIILLLFLYLFYSKTGCNLLSHKHISADINTSHQTPLQSLLQCHITILTNAL